MLSKETALPYIIDFEPVGRRGACPEGGTRLDSKGRLASARIREADGDVEFVIADEKESGNGRAIAIGLLPELPLYRIAQVGNAAGTGARLALISQVHRRQALAALPAKA